jgi:hypothetical protein
MKTMTLVILVALFILKNEYICSQITESHSVPKKHSFIFYMILPSVTTINSDRAAEVGTGTHEWGFDIGLGVRLYRHFNLTGEIGLGGMKDKNSFTNNTTAGEMESSFNTFHYCIETAIWTSPVSLSKTRDLELAAGLNAGVGGFRGIREVNNCRDCDRERYKFTSKPFIEPELNFYFFQGLFGLGTSYRYYFSGGQLLNRITVLKLILKIDY